ncbi:MAG TPA: hypothetical protein VFI12_09355 [Thermomicrobiales bacterium]|nr:hypothetical protein [Thermomicrobiales bacterium]
MPAGDGRTDVFTLPSLRTSGRVAWHLDALPYAVAAAAALVATAAAMVFAVRLGDSAATDSSDVANLLQATGILGYLIGILPFLIGSILGAPLVARELERRTAGLAWSLSADRRRWLVWRTMPAAAFMVIVLVVLALAGDVLTTARFPGQDPQHSFNDFGERGPLVVSRGVAAFAVALAAGVRLRRTLPAVLLAVAFSFGLAFASDVTRTYGIAPVELQDESECAEFSCLNYGTSFRDQNGTIVTFQDALKSAGAAGVTGGPTSDAVREWLDQNGYVEITVAITGQRYPEVEERELAATSILSAAVVLGSVVAVQRARAT